MINKIISKLILHFFHFKLDSKVSRIRSAHSNVKYVTAR